MTDCYDCEMPCMEKGFNRETLSIFTPNPYKTNGWVGGNWIPWDKRWHRAKEKKVPLCGICAATRHQGMYSERDDMEAEDLRDLLADMALNESEARFQHYRKMESAVPRLKKTAPPKPDDTTSVPRGRLNSYLERLVHPPKRAYAQAYADWLTTHKVTTEPTPKNLSDKLVTQIQSKLEGIIA